MAGNINIEKVSIKALKGRKQEFRKRILSEFPDETTKEILEDLELDTGFAAAHVAEWMEVTPAAVNIWIKGNKYSRRIKSVAKDIKLQWRYDARPLFDFDE